LHVAVRTTSFFLIFSQPRSRSFSSFDPPLPACPAGTTSRRDTRSRFVTQRPSTRYLLSFPTRISGLNLGPLRKQSLPSLFPFAGLRPSYPTEPARSLFSQQYFFFAVEQLPPKNVRTPLPQSPLVRFCTLSLKNAVTICFPGPDSAHKSIRHFAIRRVALIRTCAFCPGVSDSLDLHKRRTLLLQEFSQIPM